MLMAICRMFLHELFFNATVYWNLLSQAVGFFGGAKTHNFASIVFAVDYCIR